MGAGHNVIIHHGALSVVKYDPVVYEVEAKDF